MPVQNFCANRARIFNAVGVKLCRKTMHSFLCEHALSDKGGKFPPLLSIFVVNAGACCFHRADKLAELNVRRVNLICIEVVDILKITQK